MAKLLLTEPLIGFKEAARLAPGQGSETAHWRTIRRWGKVGRVINGTTVKLEIAHVGTKYATSAAAMERFFAACSAAAGIANPRPLRKSAAQRLKASQSAEAELAKLGFPA